MSLFGTSPDDAPTRTKSSLFSDDSPFAGGGGSSSLFDDDSLPIESSPAPNKRGPRRDLVKQLLPAPDVPDSYIDAYDILVRSDENSALTGVSVDLAEKLTGSAGLDADHRQRALNIVFPPGRRQTEGLERGEFNVLLALIGLAQEGEDLTLDSVDERRKRLPHPRIPYLDKLKRHGDENGMTNPRHAEVRDSFSSPPQYQPRQQMRRNILDDPESDPWGSPDLHHGHNHSTVNGTERTTSGLPAQNQPPPLAASGAVSSSGTINGYPNKSVRGYNQGQTEAHNGGPTQGPSESQGTLGSTGSGWDDGYGSNPGGNGGGVGGGGGAFDPNQSGLGGGFGPSGDDQGDRRNHRNSLSRTLGGGRISTPGVEDVITINMLPEKEGLFMFQHRNYEVKSARRGSSVIRRYSDFVWLVDCLHKRYPFRQIPLLPPKRIAVNGTHLAADSNSFLEKRRRGLVRFANALVRHPVLNQEQLAVMFLTVPTELSVWRKQATISVQEEFTNKTLPPDLEDSLPSNLGETFETVQSGVRRSAAIYINLCNLLDRIIKRNQGLAAEQFRLARAFQALTESTSDTYAVDTNDVPLLNNGITSTAKHLISSQGLLEDEARAWDEGALEELKAQRDCVVAMRDLFDRRDRYAKDNIPQLERRIQTNEQKLQDLRTRSEGTVKPGEIEKVEDAIVKDKESIVQQHARGVLIKECIRDELLIFQRSQYHISRLHQDWSQERVKYSELQADNWRGLSDEVEAMPTSE